MKKIIFLLLFVIPFTSLAQESNLGNWLIYFGNKKIDSDFNLHHEVQYRNYNGIGDLEQLLLRTGIGYNLTENNSNLLLGYGFINSQNYVNDEDKIGINEHRIYQQFISRQSLGIVKLQHRYRFEQRWIEDTDLRVRFRYFLSINIPFSNKDILENSWYLSAYNEIFINSESELFDRNRTYLGLGYKLNDFAKFELGYMNQFLNNGSRDQLNIITFLNF
jgi:hypothetical protein